MGVSCWVINDMRRAKLLGEKIVSSLGYPSVGRATINTFSDTTNLSIGSNSVVERGCTLQGEISIGPESRVRLNCVFKGHIDIEGYTGINRGNELIGDINTGKYCAIAPESIFRQADHKMSKPAIQAWFYNQVIGSGLEYTTKGPITVKNDVWIGTRSIILSGVTIGDGAVVGAGSVVTDDVEPYSVVAGNPAKQVKWRFPEEVRQKLLDIKWWEWIKKRYTLTATFLSESSPRPPISPISESPQTAYSRYPRSCKLSLISLSTTSLTLLG